MKKGAIALIVIVVVLLILVFSVIGSYNGLVAKNEDVNAALSQIDNQLQRRNDLIPNLVETVKGFAAQEKEIFESVAEARAKLAGAGTIPEMAEADAQVTSALSRLLAIAESYPELKSDANFRQLSDELAGTENRIATARRDYNNSAREYNTQIRRFPISIIASIFNFERFEYFEAAEGADKVPEVDFGT
ncbi:MAG: LemA family protein [Acetivibrionales bacterium]